MKNTLSLFKEAYKTNNIDILVGCEETYTRQELELYGEKNPDIRKSLTNTLIEFDGIKKSWKH